MALTCYIAMFVVVLVSEISAQQGNDIGGCSIGPCLNGGHCEDHENGYKCYCDNGYTDPHCGTDIDDCCSAPCQHGGTCTDHVNGYSCDCALGYYGMNCELENLPTCNATWYLGPDMRKCYKVFPGRVGVQTATARCTAAGAELSPIESEGEQEFIGNMAANFSRRSVWSAETRNIKCVAITPAGERRNWRCRKNLPFICRTPSTFTCPEGQQPNAGQTNCEPCAAGYYSNQTDQSACEQCAEGYSSQAGASQCYLTCPEGQQPNAGQTACEPCVAGYYSNQTDESACEQCPEGYSSQAGASQCYLTCPEGQQLNAEQSACEQCSAGYYSDQTDGSSCEQCPEGYTSEVGASQCYRSQRMMYIIGTTSTYVFTWESPESPESLEFHSTLPQTDYRGCHKCAYSQHEGSGYLAAGRQSVDGGGLRESSQTALVHDGISLMPDLPDLQGEREWPFTFILADRQYVATLEVNRKAVYSRALSNPDVWRREAVELPVGMARTARTGVVHDGRVYITGGQVDGIRTNRAWSWHPDQAAWQELQPSMQNARMDHCNLLVGAEIFVIGGHAADYSVEVYNLQTGSWSQRDPIPYRLNYSPSCAAVGTNVYVQHKYSGVYLYDTVEDSWSMVHEGLPGDMYHAAMIIV